MMRVLGLASAVCGDFNFITAVVVLLVVLLGFIPSTGSSATPGKVLQRKSPFYYLCGCKFRTCHGLVFSEDCFEGLFYATTPSCMTLVQLGVT